MTLASRTTLAHAFMAVALLSGCINTPPGAFIVPPAFQDNPRAPLEEPLVLLPIQVEAVEVDASGTPYPAPAVARELEKAFDLEVRELADQVPWLTVIDLPSLNSGERETLDQHLRLLRRVSLTAAGAYLSREEVWNNAAADLDYSIGDGLAFLRARIGARHALMIVGGRATSTGGRMALNALIAVVPSLLVPGLVFVPLGPFSTSQLVATVIDLESGDLQWLHPGDGRYRRQVDMTSEGGARRTIRAMLRAPYRQEYRMRAKNR